MKKTLTLLLTVLLTTAAANAELVASFDSLTGLSQRSGNWGFNQDVGPANVAPVFNADGTATFQDGTDVLYLTHYDSPTSSNKSSVNFHDYTLTMTISGLQAGGNSNNTLNVLFNTSNLWGLCLSSSDNTKLTGLWQNAQWNNTNNQAFSFPTDAPFTLTAVMGGSKDNKPGTSVYINGKEVAFIKGLLASTEATGYQYCIGNNSSGTKGTSFTLHNMYVHDTALTAEEVADFYASIPEPASASLSLIGLAFLVCKRRRTALQ